MDRLRIIYHRYNMRAIALLLVVVTFFNVPLTSYASVSTPSNSDNYVDSEPFYYDENGNKVYDSEIDFPVINESYEDIMWTFEEYPETFMGSAQTYSLTLTSAALYVVVAILAMFGIKISVDAARDFISNGFEPWLRRTKGAVAADMKLWQDFVKLEVAATFVGMKRLVELFREYFDSMATVNDTDIVVSGQQETSIPYYSEWDRTVYAYLFTSFQEVDGGTFIGDYVYRVNKDLSCLYFSGSDGIKASPRALDSAGVSVEIKSYYNILDNDGYFRFGRCSTESINSSKYFSTTLIRDYVSSPVPVFVNSNAANSYIKYGTTGGMLTADDVSTSIPINGIWTDLRQDFFNKYAYGDAFAVPATQEEFDALIKSMSQSQTGAEVIDTLNPAWQITTNGVLPPINNTVAYDNLSYVVKTLAGYCGAVLTQGQIDDFISSFYSSNVDGTSALVEEQSNSIVRNFVVINGGSTDPDDDERNNTYKVLKKLAVSLGAFLIGLGLVSDSPNFDGNPTISNVQVVEDLPSPAPNPNPNPDTGVDLSGVLNFLQSILNVLNTWANPLALMDSLISKLGLPTISDGIKAAINTLPKLISGELTLPELFGNVVDAIFALPQQVANAIDKALGLEKALEGLGLNKLFDNVIELLPDVLVEGFALSSLFSGLSAVVGAVPKAIAELFGLANGFSLSNVLNGLSEKIVALPEAFANKFKPSETTDSDKEDGGDSGLRKFMNALLMLAFILVILLIFFLNCLRFIVLLFAIPANTDLFNEEVLSGLNFLKETQLPLFNLSIYHLLMGAVYFVLFMSIIATLRRKINHIRIE